MRVVILAVLLAVACTLAVAGVAVLTSAGWALLAAAASLGGWSWLTFGDVEAGSA